MAQTLLTSTTAPSKWSQTGAAVTMAAVDATNGNKFPATSDALVIVRNTTGGALTFQMTAQPLVGGVGTGRSGSASQSLAAGEIRVFRVTGNGWKDANGNILLPTGLNAGLSVGIVVLAP